MDSPDGASLTILIFCIGLLLPGIFYLITLQTTLQAISPENRKTSPGSVWLLLIPLFNIIWNFIIVGYMADSIKAESLKKNFPVDEERPAYNTGLTMCILQCCTIIPVLGTLASLGSIICWIIYWTKIHAYKQRILNAIPLSDDNSGDLLRF